MESKTLDVADHMLSKLPRGTQSSTKTPLPSNEDSVVANDEIQDLVETLREIPIPTERQVRTAQSQFDGKMLQNSLPFTEMKEDLRRFIISSMKSYIRATILPVLPRMGLGPRYTVDLLVHWELEEYLGRKKYFDVEDDMDGILTLTGKVAHAQALPCGEYMKQSWPRTGAATLAAIKCALKPDDSCDSCEYPQPSPSATHIKGDESVPLKLEYIDATASDKSESAISRPLLTRMKGTLAEVVERIEQFAWFASAFRFVGKNPTALSRVDFRVVSEPSESQELVTELILLPLRSCVATEPSYASCWLPLMKSSALAWGFPIKERGSAVGLEIPFQALLKACQVPAPVEYKDSILIWQCPLKIYPTAQHRDGVQWYVVADKDFSEKLKTFPLLSLKKDRIMFCFYKSIPIVDTGNDGESIRTFVG